MQWPAGRMSRVKGTCRDIMELGGLFPLPVWQDFCQSMWRYSVESVKNGNILAFPLQEIFSVEMLKPVKDMCRVLFSVALFIKRKI